MSVRGGGHGVAGNAVSEGGLMIDLSLLKDLHIDPLAREATAAPGVLWGEFDRASGAHGLATTGGGSSITGGLETTGSGAIAFGGAILGASTTGAG